jgi:hypothetical protein
VRCMFLHGSQGSVHGVQVAFFRLCISQAHRLGYGDSLGERRDKSGVTEYNMYKCITGP